MVTLETRNNFCDADESVHWSQFLQRLKCLVVTHIPYKLCLRIFDRFIRLEGAD